MNISAKYGISDLKFCDPMFDVLSASNRANVKIEIIHKYDGLVYTNIIFRASGDIENMKKFNSAFKEL